MPAAALNEVAQCWAASFLRLQPELDQAADGFRATDLRVLHGGPGINRSDLLIVHAHDLRLTGARRFRPANFRFRLFGITN